MFAHSDFSIVHRARQPIRALAAATVLATCCPSWAQQPAQEAPERDQKAFDALNRMGSFLRTLKSFSLHGDTVTDEVLTTGQKVQFMGTVDYSVAVPNRLRAELRSETRHRVFYYDGKTLTQYAPRANLYGTIAAPPTIGETLEMAEQKYSVNVPLADLFFWGTEKSGTDDIKAASVIGVERLGGVDCEHYAFRQDQVDWQVWVRQGAQPLPCKMVITTTADPAQPQYSVMFMWRPAVGSFPKDTFAFTPPKGARKIEIVPPPPGKS